jgi:uracil phosphoribosyltransferase
MAIDYLTAKGARDITAVCLLAAPEGIKHLEDELAETDIPVKIVVGTIDERLNEKGYIVPGLGDAGDRLYGVV